MLRKIVTVLVVLFILPIFINAQERTVLKPLGMSYLPAGSSGNAEVIPLSKYQVFKMKQSLKNKNIHNNYSNPDNTLTLIDTLFTNPIPITPGSNFGFFGQDRMLMWFEAPADLFLKEVGFDFISINQPAPLLEVKIVQVVRPKNELEYLGDDWWGWYEATGNGQFNATAFLDDPDRTGPWVPNPLAPDPNEIFGSDIWSDLGVGQPFTPDNDTLTVGTYQFIDLAALGYPDLAAGTIFGVVLKNLDPNLGAGKRVGIFGNPVQTGGFYQFPLWKYYAEANTNPGQCPTLDCYGWWSRDIPLSYAAVVEIYGNTAPDINSFTVLSGGDLGPWTIDANITDENPGNPDSAGVGSAMIQWSTDGGTNWNDVAMTGSEPNFTGEIPAQPAFIKITYRISATDITNLTNNSNPVNFYTFAPSGANTLVIFNGFNDPTGSPQDFYFGPNVEFDRDTWVSGKISEIGLLNNYTNVFEIWNENAGAYNDTLIKQWLEADGGRNYLLAGQEYLGAKNGYVDSTYSAGSFEYDILGVAKSYNDVSFAGVSGQQDIPSWLQPEAGTAFGQPLLDLLNSIPDADSLMFHPTFATGNANWIDGFDVVSGAGVVVDMKVETRGIGGVTNVQTLPTMAHRTLTAGNKIIFHAFDPIALTTAVDDTYPYFYWVGADTANSVFQALQWFDIPVSVNGGEGNLPIEFALEQNYPNPFNPATTIKFSIPEVSKVTLKIYDLLGREVSTLINDTRNAGNYEVNFDASGLASGMYIYTINTDNYTLSKKMMLLK